MINKIYYGSMNEHSKAKFYEAICDICGNDFKGTNEISILFTNIKELKEDLKLNSWKIDKEYFTCPVCQK